MKRTMLILIGLLVMGATGAIGCDRDDWRVERDRPSHPRQVSGAGVRGVVLDAQGRGVAHHAVRFMHKDRVWRSETDGKGRYVFRDLPSEYEGRIVVLYEGQEFVERIRLPRRGYGQCEMRVRHRPEPVRPKHPHCEITGRVYQGRHAQPNTDVVLQIRGRRDRTARTDKHGRYTFNHVPLEQRGRITVQRLGAQGSVALYTGKRPGEIKAGNLLIQPLPAPKPPRHVDHRKEHRLPDAPARSTNTREDRRVEERRPPERNRKRAAEAARMRKQQEVIAAARQSQRERARQREATEVIPPGDVPL